MTSLMRSESRAHDFTFAARRPTGLGRQTAYWLSAIPVACLASFLALTLVTLADAGRLVPLSTISILQAIPLILLLYTVGIILVSQLSSFPHCLGLFTAAFLLRITVGITLALVFQYDDERKFHNAGLEQPYGLLSWGASRGYYSLVGVLYEVFGPSLLLPKVVNAFLGSLLPFLAYDIGQQIFNSHKSGWNAFLFTAFLPPLVIYSATNLKEIITAFLITYTVWSLIVQHRSPIVKIVGVALSISILYWLRGSPWTVILLAGVFTYIIIGETWRIRSSRILRFLPNLSLSGFLIAFAVAFLIDPIRETALSRLTEEAYFMERFEGSSATVMQFVDTSNPLSFKNLMVLFLRGLYTPAPFRFLFDYNLSTVIEASIMVVWYLLFPFAIVGFLVERHRGAVMACGILILGVLMVTTMGIMVGSNPYRHRMSVMGLVLTLAGGGVTREPHCRKRWAFGLWWLGALLFMAVWLVYRI
jgi:hypothetical protein